MYQAKSMNCLVLHLVHLNQTYGYILIFYIKFLRFLRFQLNDWLRNSICGYSTVSEKIRCEDRKTAHNSLNAYRKMICYKYFPEDEPNFNCFNCKRKRSFKTNEMFFRFFFVWTNKIQLRNFSVRNMIFEPNYSIFGVATVHIRKWDKVKCHCDISGYFQYNDVLLTTPQ